jgi:hypothetical protein
MRPGWKTALWLIGWLLMLHKAASALPRTVERQGLERDELRSEEAVALGRVSRAWRDGAVVPGWSRRAYEVVFAEDQFLTFKGHRALAMMHLAMHDALNAIEPVFGRYTRLKRDSDAHPIAAAAQAAHDVLVSQYPGQQAGLDTELAAWLAQVPDDECETRGTALGRRAARAILALREGDGWDIAGTYSFRTGPGEYQTTPPWNGFVAQPGFRFARPFGLERPEQFRPPPPPALHSPAYAAAYDEVENLGRRDSTERTDDQTAYAVWWMEFAEGSVNRLARQLVTERRTHLWRTARLFALLNMTLFDTYVAVWDAKFEHNHWRPYTAIRDAELDSNPATAPDPDWEPLRPAPPFPEYVSAHAAACAGSFQVLARTFGDDVAFSMQTTTAPPGMPTRSFPSFSAAAAECGDSRVRIGFHFRYSIDRGLVLGRQVASNIARRHLIPFGSAPRASLRSASPRAYVSSRSRTPATWRTWRAHRARVAPIAKVSQSSEGEERDDGNRDISGTAKRGTRHCRR